MDRWFSGGWLSGGWLAGGSQERKEEDRPSLDETVSSELFAEGKGDEEKSGSKDNDSDSAKGPSCLKEEENSERIHLLQGPDVDRGLEENASGGKFIERLKVVADNQNKEPESTKISDVDSGLEENASDGKFIERLRVVADNQNKEPESTKTPDVDRGLEENASDGKFIERLMVVADDQSIERESTTIPDVDSGLEENASDGKFIERLKVVADNQNKEPEFTKIPDVDRGLEENASDGKFIERLKVVADDQNKEWESTEIPDVDRGLKENASDGKFIERLKVVADNQNKEWESTSPREGEWVNKYPLRSDEPDCMHYVRTGNCRLGVKCMFNHHSYRDGQARPLNTLGPEKAAGETVKEVPEWVRQKEIKAVGETIKEVPERVRQKDFKVAGETIKEVPERVRQKEFKAAGETIKEVPERMRQKVFKAAGETIKEVPERVRQKEFKAAGETIKKVPERVRHKEFKAAGETIKEVPERMRQKEFKAAGETVKEVRERVRQKELKLHTVTGGYKSGSTFKHGHGLDYEKKGTKLELNFSGLPLRPGMSECPYYMRTGSCKFAINCRFHHPNPTVAGENFLSVNGNGGSPQLASGASQMPWMSKDFKPFEKNSDEPVSSSNASNCNLPTILFPHELHPTSDLSNYQAPINPSHSSESTHHPLASAYTLKVDGPHQQHTECQFFMSPSIQQTQMEEYPERPGEPECAYFKNQGDRKFKSACKFHHPSASIMNGPTRTAVGPFYQEECISNDPTRTPDSPKYQKAQMVETVEYPLRPGEPLCPHFMKHMNCKFGLACKFHHPSTSTLNGPTTKAYTQQPQMHECHERPSECMFHHPSSSTSNSPMMMADDLMYQQAPMGEYPQRPGEPEFPYFKKHGSSNVTKSAVENKSELKKPGKYRRSQSSRGKKGDQVPMGEYPQRPGEPECSDFMKHGSCKFRNACKFHHPSASTLSNPARQRDGQIQQLEQMEQYPERPGEPECTFFMKFGSCKLKSDCKFHHPKFHIPTGPPCVVSQNGLPLRPDKQVCSNYKRFGTCKFGPYCKFDHPIDSGFVPSDAAINSSQASSLSEFGTGLGKATCSNIEGQEPEW